MAESVVLAASSSSEDVLMDTQKKSDSNSSYPPVPKGYKLIFRWSYKHPKTGKIIRPKNGRPFPMLVREDGSGCPQPVWDFDSANNDDGQLKLPFEPDNDDSDDGSDGSN